jgi:haloacetate dehalogenase
MFDGFTHAHVQTSGAEIAAWIGGSGPPLLLLHGYPQTHVCWHRVAPALAAHYTVVATDLRGYGDAAKPPGDETHAAYSKREMARDQVEAMEALGFSRFRLAGHDRGGRVAHRLALDHPERLEKLALLDIVPTRDVYAAMDRRLGTAYYHWFFLIQPPDLPEKLIGNAPDYWVERGLAGLSKRMPFAPEALAEYRRCFRDPAAIHASCEDYRAGASIDLAHDEADLDKRIGCPLMVLWGAKGALPHFHDVVALWQARAAGPVEGHEIDCGHFIPEEAPEATLNHLLRFFA